MNKITRILGKLKLKLNKKEACLLVLLTVAAFAGNYFSASLFYGLDFIFGSIAVWLVVLVYGCGWGTIVALLASLYTIKLWGHPFGAIIFTLEALIVGLMRRRYPKQNLVMLDGIYWLLIGLPLGWLFYGQFLGLAKTPMLLIILKQPVNSIFNAAIATTLGIFFLPLVRWLSSSRKNYKLSLEQIFFNLLIIFALVPTLLLMKNNAEGYLHESEHHSKHDLIGISTHLTSEIENYLDEHLEALKAMAAKAQEVPSIGSNRLQAKLEIIEQTFPEFDRIYVTDGNGEIVAAAPPISEKGNPQKPETNKSLFLYPSPSGAYQIFVTLLPEMNCLRLEVRSLGQSPGSFVVGEMKFAVLQEQLESSGKNFEVEIGLLEQETERVILSTYEPEEAARRQNEFFIRDYEIHHSLENNTILHKLPSAENMPTIARWQQSFFRISVPVSPNIPWNVVVDAPQAENIKNLQRIYIRDLSFALKICFIALLLAKLISRKLVKSLSLLGVATTDLPDKLLEQKTIAWPRSNTSELDSLTQNFQQMAIALQEKFAELNSANQSLEAEVKARTQELSKTNQELATKIRDRLIVERALRQSENRFKILAEVSPVGIFETDAEGKCTYLNSRWCQFAGMTPEEAAGDGWAGALHPEDREPVFAEWLKATEAGVPLKIEFRMLRPDGKQLWVFAQSEAIRGKNEEITGYVGAIADITELKLVQQQLQVYRDHLESLVEERSQALIKTNDRLLEEIEERQRAAEELERRSKLEALLASISTQFINLNLPQLDGAIDDALQAIGEFQKVDRCYLFQFSADGSYLSNTHEWCAPGIKPEIANNQNLPCDAIPWIIEKLKAFELVYIPRVAKMPKTAIAEKEILQAQSIQSMLNVPIKSSDRLLGFLGFDSVQTETNWSKEAVTLLKLAGEILANTIARLQAESEQQKLALLVENSKDFISIISFEGEILYLNQASCEIFCFNNGKPALSNNISNYLPDSEWERLNQEVIPTVMKTGQWAGEQEQRHRKTGELLSLEVNTFLIKDPKTQEPLCIATIQRDITERKRYETALEQERQQLRQIIKRAPVAMAMFDTEMRYVAHSNKWAMDYALEGRSIINRSHYDIFPDIPQRWKDIHQRALQGEVMSNPEDCWVREDGSKSYLRWAIHPWYEPNGEVGGIVVVSEAIDELVEAREAALETARLKSQFLANMSHEIRTPMNGVLGMTELLLKTKLNRQQLDFARTIKTSGDGLLTIINDILDFSKLEAGEMRLDLHDFDLHACLEGILDLFAMSAAAKGLELALLVEPEVPRFVTGDSSRIRQISINLAGNALKFTETGEVVLSARVVRPREEETCVKIRFAVKDTGIGIPPEATAKLFRSFSQVDASNTRKYGGTGLGLAICKQLVELMGGEIGVESTPGQGSKFWFEIPFEVATSTPKISAPPTRQSPALLSGKKVLVVDDNSTNRKVVRLWAISWGMEVEEVANPEKTLGILQQQSFDLVLLDMQMPNLSGDMLGQLILREPSLAEVKLVLMTSVDDGDLAPKIKDIGFVGYLTKPIKSSSLYDCLLTVINDKTFFGSMPRSETIPEEKRTDEPEKLKDVKILLVEDTPVNQKVVLNQLKLLNYQADVANNGREALDKLQDGGYNIVLMDCQMPILDGYQATAAIREREGTGPRIPIIGLTANAMKGDRQKCLAAGMDDYLSKPVSIEDLETVLVRWCSEISPPTPRSSGGEEAFSPEKTIETGILPVLPIDTDRLSQLCGGDKEFQLELLRAFVDDAAIDLAAAKEAIASGDTAFLTEKAHRLKGSSAYLAVRGMPELAGRLEKQAEDNLLPGASELLAEIEFIFEEVKAYVSQADVRETSKNDPRLETPTSDCPIDTDRLSGICGGDAELELEILQSFVRDGITDIAEAKEAIASQDPGTLVEKAHRLKGSSATLGILLMPELAGRLENQARENRLERSSELLQEIELILERVKIFITEPGASPDKQNDGETEELNYSISDESAVVDSHRLAQICGGDREFQKELLEAFVEDAELELAQASAAMSAKNSEVLFQKGRAIAGSAESACVLLMPELAPRLAELAGQNRLEEAASLLSKLNEIIARVKTYIASL